MRAAEALSEIVMETATVIHEGECQTIRLPKGFHLSTPTVSVRHEGEAIVLEPLRPLAWPEGFFDSIHITDPAFDRPDQGQLPPVKSL
jgi:virulence-associated protein VagC